MKKRGRLDKRDFLGKINIFLWKLPKINNRIYNTKIFDFMPIQ